MYSMPATSTESDLIERARRGEEQAFEALFHSHKQRVYRLCLRMTGAEAEADDLTQEAFLQVFRKLATFRGEAAFTTWLHRLVVNVVIAHFRKRSVPRADRPEGQGLREDCDPHFHATRPDPVTRISVERAIAELPSNWRTVFVLHELVGHDHREIARIMKCSTANSRFLLHMARLRLRERLRPTPRGRTASEGRATLAACRACV